MHLEIDFYLYAHTDKEVNVEIKLMDKGNTKDTYVIYARNTKLFFVDTLSEINKNSLKENNTPYIVF